MTRDPGIELRCTDQIDDDVVAGLRLYAQLTNRDDSEGVIEDWLYWYRSNPFGKGVFSIAKCEGVLAGIFSLIPVEMKWDGRVVVGAKGEALVVLPDFRTNVDPATGKPLAAALMQQLKDYAFARQTQVVFSVPSREATMSNLLAGLRPIHFPHEVCLTCFSSFEMQRFRNPLLCWLGGRALSMGSAASRSIGRCRVRGGGRASFQLVSSVEHAPKQISQAFALVHPSQRMLQFRFRRDRHLIYKVQGVDGCPTHLVFSLPAAGEPLRLEYLPCAEIAPEVLAAVVRDVIRRCRRARTTLLVASLPAQEKKMIDLFQRMGYFCRPERQSVYVAHCAGDNLPDPSQWDDNLASTGFY